jgi:hypothetical protein
MIHSAKSWSLNLQLSLFLAPAFWLSFHADKFFKFGEYERAVQARAGREHN